MSAQEALILMDEPGGVEYLKRVMAIDGSLEARLVSNWYMTFVFVLFFFSRKFSIRLGLSMNCLDWRDRQCLYKTCRRLM